MIAALGNILGAIAAIGLAGIVWMPCGAVVAWIGYAAWKGAVG